MELVLMHKNTAVAKLGINDTHGGFDRILEVYSRDHLPFGVENADGAIDQRVFYEWWETRGIPKQRRGIDSALKKLRIGSTKLLSIKGMGLNLTDQYWFVPEGAAVDWRDVNYFDHDFPPDIGAILTGGEKQAIKDLRFSSPDTSSNGNLMKRWWIHEGKRYLLKGGEGPYFQEPFNEVIASRISELLEIPHIPYTISRSRRTVYSACECFITGTTELVGAWQVYAWSARKVKSKYDYYTGAAEKLGIKGVKESLDRIMALDYLIANTDRHWGNFGVLRNADTLEWEGPAPVYDCGASLWHYVDIPMIRGDNKVGSMMFRTNHTRQINLARDFTWYKAEKLDSVEDEIRAIFKQEGYKNEERIEAISRGVRGRIKKLNSIIIGRGYGPGCER
jgi:hypothetical protein